MARDVELPVEVLERDIIEGKRSDCWACPIALALRRAVGDQVHVYFSTISDGGGVWRRQLPREAVEFQRAFDAGEWVAPFRFPARVPADYVEAETLRLYKARVAADKAQLRLFGRKWSCSAN